MISGSPHPDDRLTRLLECSANAVVVTEEHCWGERSADQSLSRFTAEDPFGHRYHSRPACCVDVDLTTATEQCVARARAADVDLVVFATLEGDDFEEWQIPTKRAALERAGVRSVTLPRLRFDAPEQEWAALVAETVEGILR